ncbi:MAG TPA: NAD(P)-dependent oxidoreductase [Acidimicrobiia bacterium]|jgi:3-hydroxyisobutyrate dehydrogenase-like beta-hydroxyacid dehydrogenase|nr:NAD(P)-dependent oxidoreductase [Actinomycetota bacterium]MBT4010219.1 NAD(P)-dependent oxidoreductase [Actinomycetota bacterium]MBT4476805.1 NAD(P)-dependent oxidoreductase [Actinomycetota bacterium]HIL46944.1 NAD(P)-dependent oxidoreductase [Acidimicrobiia bacterium]
MTTPGKDHIGFIGTGNMGLPMALRLLEAGYPLTVFDLNEEPLKELAQAGAMVATNVQEVSTAADLLLTSLPRPDHVENVMITQGALSALRPGSLWVDLTTNRREFIEDLARQAPEGVSVADSPVTGAVDGARNGRLTLFIGGSPEVRKRAVKVLSHLGRVIECGELGTGNVVKLVTNQLWFIAAAALGEGFALGMANGVALDVLYDAITDSVGDSFVARHDAPSIFAGHYDPSFTLDLCLKDLGLLEELSTKVGTDLPMTETAHATFARAAERYGSDVGELHVAKRIEDDAHLSFRLDGDWTPPWEQ